MIHRLLVIALIISLASCQPRRQGPDLDLLDSNNVLHSLNSLSQGLVVFTFLSPECPLSENYTQTLLALSNDYQDRGVSFYYVFPGKFYAKEKILHFAELYGLAVKDLLFDPEQKFTSYCKASITPETFVLDNNMDILYSGAIDNWAITLGRQRQVITEKYLQTALDAILIGEEPKIKNTKAVGCIIE